MALFDFLFKGSKSEKEKKPESGKTTPGAPAQKPTAPGTAPGAAKVPVAPKPAAAPRPSGTVKLTPTARPVAPAKPASAPQPAKPAAPAPESAAKASPEDAAGGDLDRIVSALQQIEQLIAEEEGAESKSGRDRNMFPVTMKLTDVAKFAAPLFAPNVGIPPDATVEIYFKDLFSQLSRGRVRTSLKQIAQDIPSNFLRADIEQLEDKEIAVPLPLVVSAIDPMELKKRTSSVAKEAKVDNIPMLFTAARPIPSAPSKPEPKQAPPAAARPAAAVGATPQKPMAPVELKPAPAPSAPPKPAVAPAREKGEQVQPVVPAGKPPEQVVAPAPPAPGIKAEPPPVAAPKAEPVLQPKAAPLPSEPVKEVAKPAPPVKPEAPATVQPALAAAKAEAPKPVTPATPPSAPAAAPALPAQQVAAPATPTPLKLRKEPVAPAPAIKAQPVETKPPVVPTAKPPPEKPMVAKPIAEAVKAEAKAPVASAAAAAPVPVAQPEPTKTAGLAAPPPPAMVPGKITDMLLGLSKAQPEVPLVAAKTAPETPKAAPAEPPSQPKPEVVEAKPTFPPVTPAAAPAAPGAMPKRPVAKEAVAAEPAIPTPMPSIAGTGRIPPLMHRGIDLNRASPEEITARLEGIGRAMAERIVEDRTKNGPFYALYDLARVDGIGARLFEKITGWKWREDLYGQLNIVNQVLDKWDGGLPNLNLVAQRFNVISGFDACVVLHRDGHLLASSWDDKPSQAMEAMGPQIIKRVEQYIKNVCPEDMLSVTVFLHERVLILSQHEDIIFVGIRSPRALNRRHLQIVQGMAMALGKRFSGLRDAAAEATSPSA